MRRILPCLLLILTSSCSRPSQGLDDADKSIRSWSATLRVTTEEWARHRVPDTYFRQVLKAAQQEVAEQQQKLSKVSSSETDRAALDLQLIDLSHRLSALTEAVDHSDPDAARAALPPGGKRPT